MDLFAARCGAEVGRRNARGNQRPLAALSHQTRIDQMPRDWCCSESKQGCPVTLETMVSRPDQIPIWHNIAFDFACKTIHRQTSSLPVTFGSIGRSKAHWSVVNDGIPTPSKMDVRICHPPQMPVAKVPIAVAPLVISETSADSHPKRIHRAPRHHLDTI